MWDFSKRCLAHRYFPAALAVAAVVVMLPALKLGLAADDLIQRAVALRPSQLPLGIHETGIPLDSGSLPTTLRDFFFHRDREGMALMKRYGVVPWWTPDDMSLGLWRPVSAFTHWLDYRLFPDSPGLMHAENIAWFAAVVFLVALIYRKLLGPGWAAGLAAVLFLLDGNTYFPVAFVANRGFFISLFSACCVFMNIINGAPQSPVPGWCCPRCFWRWRSSRMRAGRPRWLSFSLMRWCLSRVRCVRGR